MNLEIALLQEWLSELAEDERCNYMPGSVMGGRPAGRKVNMGATYRAGASFLKAHFAGLGSDKDC